MNMKKIILGELFCGAGGFAEGARQAGFKHIWATDNHKDSCHTFKITRNALSTQKKLVNLPKKIA